MSTLSSQAQQVINEYLELPFGGEHRVRCPYFNNQRTKIRAALRVLVGKGTPTEIVEEAKVIALREHIDLDSLTAEDLKKFLVDHNLGIDCSALTYYILAAEANARHSGSLSSAFTFLQAKNLWRKLLTKLRPVENTNVAVFSANENSVPVLLSEIEPGDMIIMEQTGLEHTLNHILIVHEVKENELYYTHTFRWSKEGQYDHGVRQGCIRLTKPKGSLLDQTWEEKGMTGSDNETLRHAQLAQKLEMRRLKIFRKK